MAGKESIQMAPRGLWKKACNRIRHTHIESSTFRGPFAATKKRVNARGSNVVRGAKGQFKKKLPLKPSFGAEREKQGIKYGSPGISTLQKAGSRGNLVAGQGTRSERGKAKRPTKFALAARRKDHTERTKTPSSASVVV